MKKKINLPSPLFLLLLFTFFKGVIWAGVTPLWHFPDEQAHFAQVQNHAEFNKRYYRAENGSSTSEEIAISEKLLGTFRNIHGNNLFTFHPEYNLSYINDFFGKEEERIKSLPESSRKKMVIREATSYPPLYYFLGSRFYLLVKPFDLFIRVFIVRIFSVLATVATVWLAYKIGQQIFRKEFLSLSVAILVSFQPMFTFVGSGVSSDILFNLCFTFFIYISLVILEKGLSFKNLLGLIISLIFGILTKQQMVIAFLISLAIFLIAILKNKRKLKIKFQYLLGGLAVFFILFLVTKYGEIYRIKEFIDRNKISLPEETLIKHLIWTGRHTIAEVLPWYWGVFKWLGVVLPRWVNRVQIRVLGLTFLGLLIWLIRLIYKRRLKYQDLAIIFLSLASFMYFIAVTLWDWRFRRTYGFSFGIQGRYFFPTIIAHMTLILFGLQKLVPQKWRKNLVLGLLGWWFVLLHIGLWTVLESYYEIWPIKVLWWQVSQYKPFFFKNYWWFLWMGLYLATLIGLTKNVFKEYKDTKGGGLT